VSKIQQSGVEVQHDHVRPAIHPERIRKVWPLWCGHHGVAIMACTMRCVDSMVLVSFSATIIKRFSLNVFNDLDFKTDACIKILLQI